MKINIESFDGTKLSAVLNEYNTDSIVIMCHGIKGNKDEKGNFLLLENILENKNISSLRFDFRAHGESEGDCEKLTITDEIKDVESIIEFIVNKGYKKIAVLGASFGGGVVSMVNFKKYPQVKSIILWYPMLDYSTSTMFDEKDYQHAERYGYVESYSKSQNRCFKFGIKFLNERRTLQPFKELINCNIPKLFVTGNQDRDTNYIENSLRVYNQCKNASIKILEGLDHCFAGDENSKKSAIEYTANFITINIKQDNLNNEILK